MRASASRLRDMARRGGYAFPIVNEVLDVRNFKSSQVTFEERDRIIVLAEE